MAKSATKREPKPAPQPNLEAVQRYEAERRRNELMSRPPKGDGVTIRSLNLETLFLESLAQGWSITHSAWTIGVHRNTAYEWRKVSEASRQDDGTYKDDFCLRWDAAIEAGVDKLEDEARRRAERGVERPIYQGGVLVGTETIYSDTLMTLLMKGNRPSKFNTERHELSGPGGAAIPTSIQIEFVSDARGKK